MKNNKLKSIFLGLGVLTLASCAQPELPQDHYYRIDVNTPQSGEIMLDGVLEIERFRADGLVSGRPIVYTEGKGHLSEYHYHFWVEPPVDLLQDTLVKFLRASNIARHVVTPDMRIDEEFLLTGKIKRLERDLSNGDNIAVEVEIGLKEVSSDKILVLNTYIREMPLTSSGVQGAVDTFEVAISEIYAQFLEDVR